MPNIFIECTFTFESTLNTGIQRVVRNVIRHAATVAAGYGYVALPVKIEGSRFVEANISIVLSDKRLTIKQPSVAADEKPASFFRLVLQAGRLVLRKCVRLIVILLPFNPVRRFFYGQTARRTLMRQLRIPLSLVGIRLPPLKPSQVIHPNPGDILLLLDASWATEGPWAAIRHFKRHGGHVVGVIYDFIQLDYPHVCFPEDVAVFKHWFGKLTRVADAFVCISSSVAQQLYNHLSVQYPSHRAAITHFHLGSELDLLANDGDIRPPIKELFTMPRHIFIVVGSIEPRKNHAFILDAFERFWRAGGKASLVLIGGHGWKIEAILERIANHPELDRQLFLIRDASDTELDYAYRNASALVIASQIEGFGLPIVEAFQHGLPVLCSDIPVFREVADGKAQFFSLDDPSHLTDSLLHFSQANDVSLPRRRSPQPWLTWRESTEQLFAVLMKIFPPANADKPKTSGGS